MEKQFINPHGEVVTGGGKKEAANQYLVDNAKIERFKLYEGKIKEAKEKGINELTEMLTYEELQDYLSLENSVPELLLKRDKSREGIVSK